MGRTWYNTDETFLITTFIRNALFKILKYGLVGNFLGIISGFVEKKFITEIINYST